jgi:hypothetical protein
VFKRKVEAGDGSWLLVVLSKGLDFILPPLVRLRVLLEHRFPKLVVTLLVLPFAVLVFLFGWLITTLALQVRYDERDG